jgi:hypothetical protein
VLLIDVDVFDELGKGGELINPSIPAALFLNFHGFGGCIKFVLDLERK